MLSIVATTYSSSPCKSRYPWNRQNRTGMQYCDQFLQDIMPQPPHRPGIPMLSDLIHPIFRIETTYGICKCREIEETQVTDEKWASVNLPLPRIDLQQSLNEYMNEDQVSRCLTCKQFRHRCCRVFFRGRGKLDP